MKYVIVETAWEVQAGTRPEQNYSAQFLVVEDGKTFKIPEAYAEYWHDTGGPRPARKPEASVVQLPEHWDKWDVADQKMATMSPCSACERVTSENIGGLLLYRSGRYYFHEKYEE